MTAHEFLVSEGVTNMGAQFTAFNIEIWLEEYANYRVNQVLGQYIAVQGFKDTHRFIKLMDYKEEIMNSIKNK